MNIKCPVCDGYGKVPESFGLGKCKEITGDLDGRVCPGCDGTGIQYEDMKPVSYPPKAIVKKEREKPGKYVRGK